jgi:hypothetical protein
VALVRPAPPADRIDDLAFAGGLLLALDATPPGHLLSYALDRPRSPLVAAGSVPVPVGPFSGVSAAAGLVAVSGGTSLLTLRELDGQGHFGAEVATADFGRGQPDIALRADGRLAAVSTHLYGPEFALVVAGIERRPLRLRALGRIRLPEAGFTAGGFHPAHFPLVARWDRDRLYVAAGGGLSVIDASDPAHPRLLHQDRRAAPATDLSLDGGELEVLRAGPEPALVRYRLGPSGLPALIAPRRLRAGALPGALARFGSGTLLTRLDGGWRLVP